LAELSFERPDYWATDFILEMKDFEETHKMKFAGVSKWSYQWIGKKKAVPRCLSR
jgi:hypothetical protein